MPEQLVGKITHYFSRLGVAGIKLDEPLGKGERIHIFGHTTDMEQKVVSMEIDHGKVEIAHPGDNVAIRVKEKVRENDEVYVVLEEELSAA
jgi:putative protease